MPVEAFDPYAALGIDRSATAEEITAAYRKAAAAAHPDREGGSTERMTDVNVAYEILSDPDRRSSYDRTGKAGLSGEQLRKRAVEFMTPMVGLAIRDPMTISNLVATVRGAIMRQKAGLQASRVTAKHDLEGLRRRLDRVHGPKDNFILAIIRSEIEKGERLLEVQDLDEQVMDRALVMLGEYSDVSEVPAADGWGSIGFDPWAILP